MNGSGAGFPPEQYQVEGEETSALTDSGKRLTHLWNGAPLGSGNGQRIRDAPCGSPAAAGLPREFPRRKTCSP